MARKKRRHSTGSVSDKLYAQLKISIVALLIGCLIVVLLLSVKYKVYDYNIPMRILAITPSLFGATIITAEYILIFSRKCTQNEVSYLKRGWKKPAIKLIVITYALEILISLVLGLLFDRNNNMLRFILDNRYSGIIVLIANMVLSTSVLLIQRFPLVRRRRQ